MLGPSGLSFLLLSRCPQTHQTYLPLIMWLRETSTVFSLGTVQFSSSVLSDSLRPYGLQNSQSLLKLMSIELVMSPNHLILCCPLLLLPSFFPSLRVFSNESVVSIRWPKYWSFSFSIGPSNEYSGLISFRMDCLDLFAVQGTLKNTTVQTVNSSGVQTVLICISVSWS